MRQALMTSPGEIEYRLMTNHKKLKTNQILLMRKMKSPMYAFPKGKHQGFRNI